MALAEPGKGLSAKTRGLIFLGALVIGVIVGFAIGKPGEGAVWGLFVGLILFTFVGRRGIGGTRW